MQRISEKHLTECVLALNLKMGKRGEPFTTEGGKITHNTGCIFWKKTGTEYGLYTVGPDAAACIMGEAVPSTRRNVYNQIKSMEQAVDFMIEKHEPALTIISEQTILDYVLKNRGIFDSLYSVRNYYDAPGWEGAFINILGMIINTTTGTIRFDFKSKVLREASVLGGSTLRKIIIEGKS